MEANCFWKLIETTIDIMCQLNIITCGKEHDVRKEGRKEGRNEDHKFVIIHFDHHFTRLKFY